MERSQFYTNPAQREQVNVDSGSKFTGKVFLYMFIALAISAAVAGLCGFMLSSFLNSGNEQLFTIYVYFVAGAIIAYIPLIIWIQVSVLRGGKGLTPAFIIYSILMGVVISLFTALIPFELLAISFGLTCLSFGSMALIAWTSKKNLSNLAVVSFGLLTGAILISLTNIIWYFINPEVNVMLNVLVSGLIFISVIIITIVDLFNVRKIAQRGETSSNIAMVCAFNLYVDFIYIFLRILAIVIKIFGSKR